MKPLNRDFPHKSHLLSFGATVILDKKRVNFPQHLKNLILEPFWLLLAQKLYNIFPKTITYVILKKLCWYNFMQIFFQKSPVGFSKDLQNLILVLFWTLAPKIQG